VQRQQGEELAGLTLELAFAADDVRLGGAEVRIDLELRVALVAEEGEPGRQVVEPAAGVADDYDSLAAEGERLVERELEIYCVLPRGVAHDPGAGPLCGLEPRVRHRVEVADRDGDLELEGESGVHTPVGGDDRSAGWQMREDAGLGLPGGDNDDGAALALQDVPPLALPRSGSRVGGAVAALSARLPELPVSLPGS
jgi:hypothetical protein